eukprot:TRINITY_DN2349_c0_g2_i1.p1 TRINITY_DN2349_c0_g2~~TRINITY_DN2349_c0_g2_i1.p1  ORF type:complete len:595 (+),score=57.94 TRINITY_DN2349_c0_g2_i1:92-1786(+)
MSRPPSPLGSSSASVDPDSGFSSVLFAVPHLTVEPDRAGSVSAPTRPTTPRRTSRSTHKGSVFNNPLIASVRSERTRPSFQASTQSRKPTFIQNRWSLFSSQSGHQTELAHTPPPSPLLALGNNTLGVCLRGLDNLPPGWSEIVGFAEPSSYLGSAEERWWARDDALSTVRHVGFSLWCSAMCAALAVPCVLWWSWLATSYCDASVRLRVAIGVDAAAVYCLFLCLIAFQLHTVFGRSATDGISRWQLPVACAVHCALTAAGALVSHCDEVCPQSTAYRAVTLAEVCVFLVVNCCVLRWSGELLQSGPSFFAALGGMLSAVMLAVVAFASFVPETFAEAPLGYGDLERWLIWIGVVWPMFFQGTAAIIRVGVAQWPAPLHKTHGIHVLGGVVFTTWGRLMMLALPQQYQILCCTLLGLQWVVRSACVPRLWLRRVRSQRGGAVLDENDPSLQALRLASALSLLSELQAEACGVILAPTIAAVCAWDSSLLLRLFWHGSVHTMFLLVTAFAVTFAAHSQKIPVAGLHAVAYQQRDHLLALLPAALVACVAVVTQSGKQWMLDNIA